MAIHSLPKKELLEVISSGIDSRWYDQLREVGITHKQVMKLYSTLPAKKLTEYQAMRTNGASHEEALEVMEFLDKNIRGAYDYIGMIIHDEVSHEEAMEFIRMTNYSDDCGLYPDVRNFASHQEIIEVMAAGFNLYLYGRTRRAGAGHQEAMEAFRKGKDAITPE